MAYLMLQTKTPVPTDGTPLMIRNEDLVMVQEMTGGAAMVTAERHVQFMAGHTIEHDLEAHGAEGLLVMARVYAAYAQVIVNGDLWMDQDRHGQPWMVPAGRSAEEYAAIAGALCAAAIDAMTTKEKI